MITLFKSITYAAYTMYIFHRPKQNHPAFYGCFDWHSSVHGHWLLATVARRFPGTELANNVTRVFKEQLQVKLDDF